MEIESLIKPYLIKPLRDETWISVLALRLPNWESIVDYLVVQTPSLTVQVGAKAQDLKDGSEVYLLWAFEFTLERWKQYIELAGDHLTPATRAEADGWVVSDMKETAEVNQLSHVRRRIRFFCDPDVNQMQHPPSTPYDLISGMIVGAIEDSRYQIGIRASLNSPCSLEVAVGADGVRYLFDDLREVIILD